MILLHRLRTRYFKQLADVSLQFPDKGTVLIEGLNEAGKSSLFEAVFFALYGQPLLSDRDYAIRDLKSYGAEKMDVELDFSIDGRPFALSRSVGTNHTAVLTCPPVDGEAETLRTLSTIRDRLREEMRLSADALLNTCFVEQKGLERLESLNARERRETVNDLLNLRVLTVLEAEYRVARPDEDRLQLLRQRLRIAGLDADLPALKEAARAAQRCLLYSRLLRCEEQLAQLEGWIAAVEARAAEIAGRRASIRTTLDQISRLKARITAIQGDLALRVRGWNEALVRQDAAARRVRDLKALAARLPEEEARLREWETLRERLERLEGLELEAVQTHAALQEAAERLARRDEVEKEWLEGKAQGRALTGNRVRAEAALAAAEARQEARVLAARRSERLALLLQHVSAGRRAGEEVRQLTAQGEQTRRRAALLEPAKARVAALGDADARVRQEAQDRQELTRVADALNTCRGTLEGAAKRGERVRTLQESLEELDRKLEAARVEERAARAALAQAEARVALGNWAEAAERCAEADPASGRLGELERRAREARGDLDSAKRREQETGRLLGLAYGAAAVGLLVGGGGAAAHQGMTLGLLGLIACIAAVAWALLLGKKLAAARAAGAKAQSAWDGLEGERRAVESQARAAAGGKDRWLARERECREALSRLGVAIPADAASARQALAGLPDMAPAAREQYAAAREAAANLAAEREVTSRSLRSERDQAVAIDTGALEARIGDLERTHGTLRARLDRNGDLSRVVQALGLESAAGLSEALEAARRQVAESAAALGSLPGLERQAEERFRTETSERGLAGQLAEELHLSGKDPEAWAVAAHSEREAYSRDVEATPDAVLENGVRKARGALLALQQGETRLETEQTRRREELDRVSREALAAAEGECREALAGNDAARQPLAGVRTALESAGLPLLSPALRTRLAVARETLDRQRAEAQTLPASRETLDRQTNEVSERRQDLAEAWRLHLEAPLPSTPEEAEGELQTQKARSEREILALGEANLIEEDTRLEAEAAEGDRKGATWIHQRDEARHHQTALLGQLRELGVSGELRPAEMPERYPELVGMGELDPAGWELELQSRQDAVRANRSDRRALAQTLALGDDALELPVEQEALAEAERDLAVKRRAGEMVTQTRQSIVNRVMPLTMQNMRQILPLLTEGRYQDGEWDEGSNLISVYDTRAASFQRKRVFSGGARDQISLALRLAFALATLPGEYNVRPGWLFLDEPLSSFDHSRTQALVDLLTRGLIRRHFAQIFLISHSQSFDPGRFDYRMRMDAGQVVDSNLPAPPSLARASTTPLR
jgi:DNA repair exonuclease SbcCD ATPase subunit